jgi:hypothetical protein
MNQKDDSGHYLHLCERLRKRMVEKGWAVEYPPATEAQLRATEEALGFPIPPLLRLMYQEVANGGHLISDQYTLFGAIGGCAVGAAQGEPRDTIIGTIDQLVSRSGWRLDDRVKEAWRRHPGTYLDTDAIPDQFLWLAILDYDYGANLYLDGLTGELYGNDLGYSMYEHLVALHQTPYEGSEYECGPRFVYEAPSLEKWIMWHLDPFYPQPRWERGELTQTMRHEPPRWERGELTQAMLRDAQH